MRIRDDVLLGQHSHVGMARTANEDFFGYWESDDDRAFDLKGRLVVVCDGMGGHAGGEIASRLAVRTVIELFQADTTDDPMESLRRAIEGANEAIYKEGFKPQNTKLRGMGSTCTTLVHRREMVYFGQVGDSRCYLIRGGQIQQMTKDHSLVQQLVDEGLLDKSEMENHPDKNVILRSMGVKPQVDVDVSYVPAAVGDVYLLCSDGLSGLVSEKEMLQIVSLGIKQSPIDLRKICEQLVDLANRYGGHDNITVQLLMVQSTGKGKTDTTRQETVTASFTPEEVAASVAKARAAAAAKAGGGAPDAASAGIPVTQAAMPVANLDAPPSAAPMPSATPAPASGGGGGGILKIFLALFLGAAIVGGGALWFFKLRRPDDVSDTKVKEVQTLVDGMTDATMKTKAATKLDAARKAIDAKNWHSAEANLEAARILAGGG